MEAKKNPAMDVHRKSGYFFSIGLVTSLSLVAMAFEWRQPVDPKESVRGKRQDDLMPNIDVPITSITPPPPPARAIFPVIKEVKDNVRVDTTSIILDNEGDPNAPIIPPIIIDEPEDDPGAILVFPEVSASPMGGFSSFYVYVSQNLKYPTSARRMGIEGKVFIEFIVEKDGSLSDVKIIKGIYKACDDEAARVIQQAPPWNPGLQRGKPVRQRYTLPIGFQLN